MRVCVGVCVGCKGQPVIEEATLRASHPMHSLHLFDYISTKKQYITTL